MPIQLEIDRAIFKWQAKHNQHITYVDLARKCNISLASLNRLKNGDMTKVDLLKLNQLCKVLECEIYELLVRYKTGSLNNTSSLENALAESTERMNFISAVKEANKLALESDNTRITTELLNKTFRPTPEFDIFLSYNRNDWDEFAKKVIDDLKNTRFRIWVDQNLLQGGEDWLDEINNALHKSRCLVLCVSPEAVNSKYVKIEFRHFFREGKPIVPVMCQVTTDLPVELAGLQFIPFGDFAALRVRLSTILS